MPSRRTETLRPNVFTVGSDYSRSQIAELGGVAPLDNSREWTGIVEFSNCILLFPTLDTRATFPQNTDMWMFSTAASLSGNLRTETLKILA